MAGQNNYAGSSMIILPEPDILYLVDKANKIGAQGKCVIGIILLNQDTQSIRDTMWVTDDGGNRTDTNKAWWEE